VATYYTTATKRATALSRRGADSTYVHILGLSLIVVFEAASKRSGGSDYLGNSVSVSSRAVANSKLGDAVVVKEHGYKHLDLVVVLDKDLQQLASDLGEIQKESMP
jgi:hypothetical protein